MLQDAKPLYEIDTGRNFYLIHEHSLMAETAIPSKVTFTSEKNDNHLFTLWRYKLYDGDGWFFALLYSIILPLRFIINYNIFLSQEKGDKEFRCHHGANTQDHMYSLNNVL